MLARNREVYERKRAMRGARRLRVLRCIQIEKLVDRRKRGAFITRAETRRRA